MMILKDLNILKDSFVKYEVSGKLKVRLALNHIIVLQNVFGVEACVTLLLYKIDVKHWSILKTLLTYLDYLYPDELNSIVEDDKIKNLLRGFYGN